MQELQTTATFQIPLVLVWEAWTDPEKIIHWWGPDGFQQPFTKWIFGKKDCGN